jgi:NAD-dependent dihydropyrimidine dehydrogenase PreA subunit
MIRVDQALCDGCGACVDECPIGAIDLYNGAIAVDTDVCNECGVCIDVCPNQALALIAQPVAQIVEGSASLPVRQPSSQVLNVATQRPVPWRAVMLPAVSGALSWVGREVVPRLAPLALDALQGALDRRLSWSTGNEGVRSLPKDGGRGRRRRHRYRKGRRR